MELDSETVIKKITNLILTSPQKMIREEDLKTISKNLNFEEIMSAVYLSLQNVGFELIKTHFFDQGFYVLTAEGIDDDITPTQYGLLALIAAIGKELEEDIPIKDLKELFSELWNTDITYLIDNDYLRKIEDFQIIRLTPTGKAILKNIYKSLKLKNLIEVFDTN